MNKIKIGWTLARLRERAPAPTRCYKCHGFGHTRSACKGPDLSSACRKCGEGGHMENSCTADGSRCVACERQGHVTPAHRTGTASCMAWRSAMTQLRTGIRDRGGEVTEKSAAEDAIRNDG